MVSQSIRIQTPADEEWGYQFGIDGVLTMQQAEAFLQLHADTIKQRISAGQIRAGKDRRQFRICRRSVLDYLRELEL